MAVDSNVLHGSSQFASNPLLKTTEVGILCPTLRESAGDAIIESGMEAGLQDALDLLEQVTVSLR
jgi:hypothetical protein